MFKLEPGAKIGAVRPVAENVTPVLWDSLTDSQKALAIETYFCGDAQFENAVEYFTYEPDLFIVVDGVAYDVDGEAVAVTRRDMVTLFCAATVNHSLRYLPTSANDDGVLFIRYDAAENKCSFDVFRVEVF